ncbi:MAG: hypothetical protein AABX54_03035 [Nanoarchaeota archaeon]
MPFQNLTLENAIAQFDCVTSQLVLHPFNGEGDDVEKRREHVYKTATNVYLASSRLEEVLERDYKNISKVMENSDAKLAETYLANLNAAKAALTKIISWYSKLELKECVSLKKINPETDKEKYEKELEKLKKIQKERTGIANFRSILGIMGKVAKEIIRYHSYKEEKS